MFFCHMFNDLFFDYYSIHEMIFKTAAGIKQKVLTLRVSLTWTMTYMYGVCGVVRGFRLSHLDSCMLAFNVCSWLWSV